MNEEKTLKKLLKKIPTYIWSLCGLAVLLVIVHGTDLGIRRFLAVIFFLLLFYVFFVVPFLWGLVPANSTKAMGYVKVMLRLSGYACTVLALYWLFFRENILYAYRRDLVIDANYLAGLAKSLAAGTIISLGFGLFLRLVLMKR